MNCIVLTVMFKPLPVSRTNIFLFDYTKSYYVPQIIFALLKINIS